MGLITSFATLQTELKDELDKSDDTTSPFTRFIQNFEEAANRDPRIKKKVSTTLSVDAEEENLPSDFKEMVSLAHDGSTVFADLENVPVGQLPQWKAVTNTTSGVPVKFAILDDGARLRFAPVPDTTYTLDFTYWQNVTPLSSTVLTNWLLDDHSDIYLAGSVVEAAKYFRDQEKMQEARAELDRKIEELNLKNANIHEGGPKSRTPIHTIG